MSKEDESSQVFKGTTTEDVRLENLGYEQGESTRKPHRSSSECSLDANLWSILELKRSFGLLSMIGFSFSVVTS
jgi:hypothetical protein